MTVERRKLLLVGRDEQGLRVVAADALQALEALLDPEDHLPFPHPSGECPGECQEVRRVLGVGEASAPVPVPHHLSTWERDIRLTALRDALETVRAYGKEQEDGRAQGYEDARAKSLAAEEIATRLGKLCLTSGAAEQPAKPAAYVPPPEMVAKAEADWEGAQQDEKDDAARLYERLIARPGRRSAVSGASLPSLPQCSALVRAGWLDVAREVRNWVG